MKRFPKLIVAVAVVMSIGLAPASAQQKGQIQFKAGAGVFSFPDYLSMVLVGFGSIDNADGVTRGNFIPITNPSVEVEFLTSDKFSIGGFFTFGVASSWTTVDATGEINTDATSFYPSLGLAMTTRYFRSDNFSMYGSWGVGATIITMRQTSPTEGRGGLDATVIPAANIYPLGFKFGDTKGWTVEVGWGSKGIVSFGGFTYF